MALDLFDFRMIRAILQSALDYALANQDNFPEAPGYITERQIADLRASLQRCEIRTSRVGESSEVFGPTEALQAQLESLRQWLCDSRKRLEAGKRSAYVLALADHGVQLIERAQAGEATHEEVVNHIRASEEAIAIREAEGADPAYLAIVRQWLEVWYRLADTLAEVPSELDPEGSP
ncbi:MAG: hypothetical protein J2P57_04870 [Acidimicrobiaceae bacterium]|nr:hypothetical protein [Acidimicrobiaceae bacterium]